MHAIGPIFSLVGSDHTLEIAGVRLLGFNEANGRKLVLSVILFSILYLLSKSLRFLANQVGGKRQRIAFWTRQGISLVTFLLGIAGFVSIWFRQSGAPSHRRRVGCGGSRVCAAKSDY
jgi:hypothetical protein